jgi:hypothetical protein
LALERAGRKVTGRILKAEKNNAQWVKFYCDVLTSFGGGLTAAFILQIVNCAQS